MEKFLSKVDSIFFEISFLFFQVSTVLFFVLYIAAGYLLVRVDFLNCIIDGQVFPGRLVLIVLIFLIHLFSGELTICSWKDSPGWIQGIVSVIAIVFGCSTMILVGLSYINPELPIVGIHNFGRLVTLFWIDIMFVFLLILFFPAITEEKK